jgi:hypothetical protein
MRTVPDPLPDHRLGGFCLYALVDPRDGTTFYIGKCRNAKARSRQHARGPLPRHQRKLTARLVELRQLGIEPEFHVVAEIRMKGPWRWGGAIARAAENRLIAWLAPQTSLVNGTGMPKENRRPAIPA